MYFWGQRLHEVGQVVNLQEMVLVEELRWEQNGTTPVAMAVQLVMSLLPEALLDPNTPGLGTVKARMIDREDIK